MADVTPQLTERQMADLCALADGSLPADRREAVESWVSASSELQAVLDRQRRSLAATRAAATEPLPASLRTAVEARVPVARRGRSRWLVPRLAVSAAAAAVLVAGLIVGLNVLGGGPTATDAAALATQPPNAPAPAQVQGSPAQLTAAVEGVSFPDFQDSYGWRAAGTRRDTVHGRDAVVVYYQKGSRQIAYVIVSGSALPAPSGVQGTALGGVDYDVFSSASNPAVTWLRAGHTCVLTGAASRAELLTLASWKGGGTPG